MSTSAPGSGPSMFRISAALLLSAGTVYTGAAYYALQDEEFRKFWNKQVPGGQAALDIVDAGVRKAKATSIEDIKQFTSETALAVGKTVKDAKETIEKASETVKEKATKASETLSSTYQDSAKKVHQVSDQVQAAVHSTSEAIDKTSKKIKHFAHDVEQTVTSVQKVLLDQEEKPKEHHHKRHSSNSKDQSSSRDEEVEKATNELRAVEKHTVKVIADSIESATEEAQKISSNIEKRSGEIISGIKTGTESVVSQAKDLVTEVKDKFDAAKTSKVIEEARQKAAAELDHVTSQVKALATASRSPKIEELKAAAAEFSEKVDVSVKELGKIIDALGDRPALKAVAESLGSIADSVKSATPDSTEQTFEMYTKMQKTFVAAVDKFKSSLKADSDRIQELLEKHEIELIKSRRLDEKVKKNILDNQRRELEKEFQQTLVNQKKELEVFFAATLESELRAKEKALTDSFNEEMQKHSFEVQEHWKEEAQKMILQERSMRLDKVDALQSKLQLLEEIVQENNKLIERNEYILHATAVVKAFGNVLNQPFQSSFKKEYTALVELAKDNDFLQAVLGSIPEAAADQGVPSYQDLESRFRTVSKSIRKAQLMPDHGGPVEYAVASISSNLLLPRKGLVRGNDVESILARTEYYLDHKNVDQAARELNQLQGRWVRILARDWLVEARRHLQVKQALELVEAHISMLNTGAL